MFCAESECVWNSALQMFWPPGSHRHAERVLQLDGRQQQGPAKPAIRPVQQSELMSKLQQFIPQLASANKKLEEEPEAAGMEIQGWVLVIREARVCEMV